MTPMPGDLVRFTGTRDSGYSIDPGDLGVIDGMVGRPQAAYLVCWGCYSAFRGKSWGEDSNTQQIVSCSGGPAYRVEAAWLKPTGELLPREFWLFPGTPRAHTGVKYTLTVPVWEWSPERRQP